MSLVSFMNLRLTIVIALIVIVGTGFQLLPISIVRIGAIMVLLVQVYLERRSDSSQFLTSPLFLLGASALFFFSFILGVVDTTYLGLPFHTIETFYGSDAERLFVGFGLCCVVLHSLIAGRADQSSKTIEGGPVWAGKYLNIFAAIALFISLANVANYMSLKSGGLYIATVQSIAAPLLGFCLVFLIRQSIQVPTSQKLLIALVIVLSISGLFYIHEGKKPFFIIVACLLYWLRLKKVSAKKLIVFAAVFIPLAISLVQITEFIRKPYIYQIPSKDTMVGMIGAILKAKVILRQTETRYCFQNVIDKRWEQPLSAKKQLFWLKGLVPRGMWPEKPSLSLGREYAKEYCGEDRNLAHTNSISLLGQPIIHGGGIGLLLHGGILIACLGGLVWLGRDPYSQSTVAIVALLPFLIDFDQDFAMYVANTVKFCLTQSPLYLLAACSKTKQSDTN